jgi:hypothetical protein
LVINFNILITFGLEFEHQKQKLTLQYSVELSAIVCEDIEYKEEILEESAEQFLYESTNFVLNYFPVFQSEQLRLNLISFILYLSKRNKRLLKKEISRIKRNFGLYSGITPEIERDSTKYLY